MNELQRNEIENERKKNVTLTQRFTDMQTLDSKMANRRMNSCLALIDREMSIEKANQEKTDHDALVNARAYKEMALAKELVKVKNQEIRDLSIRLKIREDDGLKEFSNKIKRGYNSRDLLKQIQNNEFKKLQERQEQIQQDILLEDSMYTDKVALVREEYEHKFNVEKHRDSLLYQIHANTAERERRKQVNMESQKRLLEDFKQKMKMEDEKQKKAQLDFKLRTKREIEEFEKLDREAKRLAALKQKEEDDKINRQAAEIAARSSNEKEEKLKKLQLKDEFNRRVGEKIMAAKSAKEAEENEIRDLNRHELFEKDIQNDIAEKLLADKRKNETLMVLNQQVRQKHLAQIRQKEEDIMYRIKLEEINMKETKREEEKEALMKLKKMQYIKDLRSQMKDHEERNARAKKAERYYSENNLKSNIELKAAVEEERNRIIEQHVPHVIGYLTSGTLKPEEVPYLKRGVQKHPHLHYLDLTSLENVKPQRRASRI